MPILVCSMLHCTQPKSVPRHHVIASFTVAFTGHTSCGMHSSTNKNWYFRNQKLCILLSAIMLFNSFLTYQFCWNAASQWDASFETLCCMDLELLSITIIKLVFAILQFLILNCICSFVIFTGLVMGLLERDKFHTPVQVTTEISRMEFRYPKTFDIMSRLD